MARDEDNYKEGVDFKWVPMKDSNGKVVKDGKGGAVKTRHFFTKKEKEAMNKPAPKKEAPKKKTSYKEPPVAKSAKVPEVTTTKLSSTKGGRGDGLIEMTRRAIDRAEGEKKKSSAKPSPAILAPAAFVARERRQMKPKGKPHNPSNKPGSTMKPGFQGRYTTSVVPGGINAFEQTKQLGYGGRGGGMINRQKNRLKTLE